MKKNTKEIGENSEAQVLAKFISLGYKVLIPFGDNQRYDFVIDRGFGFERVQVKTARLRNGCITFSVSSSTLRKNHTVFRRDYKGQCDWFAAYVPELDKTYLIKIDDDSNVSTYQLRLEETKNNNEKRVRWAKDLEI